MGCDSQIKVGGHHHDIADGHAARPGEHENDHFGDFAGFQQAARGLGFFEFFHWPVGQQRGDHGAG